MKKLTLTEINFVSGSMQNALRVGMPPRHFDFFDQVDNQQQRCRLIKLLDMAIGTMFVAAAIAAIYLMLSPPSLSL